jgi:NAD(P)-dependent dehydrogenase (short-subunit alcohol dehydrogenase family)
LCPPAISTDGHEGVFAINHLAHAMVISEFLPVLEKTAALPDSDVRVVSLTSLAWGGHPPEGITFATLRTPQAGFLGQFTRYS